MKFLEKLKKDNTSAPRPKKLININALKKSGFLTLVIVAVLVIVIFLNVGTTLLDQRGYLKFDLTPEKANTLSDTNIEFIKKEVDKPVNITVLCTESEYTSMLGEYLAYYVNVTTEEDYFSQTVKLLHQYEEINSNITVEFVDISSAQGKAITTEYPNAFYGDIYVEVEGKDGTKKNKLLSYDKIYPYSDPTGGYAAMGYGSYYIDGNDLETVLTSAINTLLNGNDETLGIINAHTTTTAVSNFETYYTSQLEYNGFSTVKIDGTVLKEIPEEVTVLAIVAPNADYLESEIKLISEWLMNDGERGRALIFCPGDTISDMPVLTQFLEEWGISYQSGYVYQTDDTQYYQDPRYVFSYTEDNDLVKEIKGAKDGAIFTTYNLPIKVAFENYGSKSTHVIASTNDAATICPVDAASDWKPSSSATKKSYPTIIMTEDSTTVDGEIISSYVVAFSAFDVVRDIGSESFINLDITISSARYAAGIESSSQMLFVTRVLETQTFEGEVSEAGGRAITAIFLIGLPVILIVAGTVIWIYRRRRGASSSGGFSVSKARRE